MTTKQRLALMGQVVTVHAILTPRKTSTRREYARIDLRTPRAGWVVGFRNAMTGKIDYGHGEGVNFIGEKATPCMLVAFWPTETPVRVPLDGFALGGTVESPKWAQEAGAWTKADMRESPHNYPRDAHGRFVR